MIDKTSYAVSNDETRYNLNGVYFEVLRETAAMPWQVTRPRVVARKGASGPLLVRPVVACAGVPSCYCPRPDAPASVNVLV